MRNVTPSGCEEPEVTTDSDGEEFKDKNIFPSNQNDLPPEEPILKNDSLALMQRLGLPMEFAAGSTNTRRMEDADN